MAPGDGREPFLRADAASSGAQPSEISLSAVINSVGPIRHPGRGPYLGIVEVSRAAADALLFCPMGL